MANELTWTAEAIDKASKTLEQVDHRLARLEGRTRETDEQMKRTSGSAKDFSNVLAGNLAAEGMAAVLSQGPQMVAQLVSMQRELGGAEAEARRFADVLQVSRKEYAATAAALESIGVDGKETREIFTTLAERQQQALAGGDQADVFERIGVSVDQLRGKKPTQILELVEQGLRETNDASKATSAAVELLGDDLGNKLVSRLQSGQASMSELRETAIGTGQVLSDDLSAQLAEVDDRFSEMDANIKGTQKTLSAALAPATSEGADALGDLSTIGGAVVEGLSAMHRQTAKTSTEYQILTEYLKSPLTLLDTLSGAVREHRVEQQEANEQTTVWQESLSGLGGALGEVEARTAEATGTLAGWSDTLVDGIGQIAEGAEALRADQIERLKADIVNLQTEKLGLDDAMKIARTEERIGNLRARIKDIKAEMAAAAGEAGKAERLRAEARRARARGDQGVSQARRDQPGGLSGFRGDFTPGAGRAAQARRKLTGRRVARNARFARAARQAERVEASSRARARERARESIMEAIEEREKKIAEARQEQMDTARALTSDVFGLTGALGELSGVSDRAMAGVSGLEGVISNVLGGLQAGGPAGVAGAVFGGATSILGAASRIAGGRRQQRARRERRRRREERQQREARIANLRTQLQAMRSQRSRQEFREDIKQGNLEAIREANQRALQDVNITFRDNAFLESAEAVGRRTEDVRREAQKAVL